MRILPAPIQDLIGALERLPGIGPKSASRLAFFILRSPQEMVDQLVSALEKIKSSTGTCSLCYHITLAGQELCEVCADPTRKDGTICVVEDAMDVLVRWFCILFGNQFAADDVFLSPDAGTDRERAFIPGHAAAVPADAGGRHRLCDGRCGKGYPDEKRRFREKVGFARHRGQPL